MRNLWMASAFFLIFATPLIGVNFEDFEPYQERFTHEDVQRKIERFLQKSPHIKKNYELTTQELRIGDIEEQKYDYILKLSKVSTPRPRLKKTLKGSKIAIDPGHLGGHFARLEHRFVHIKQQDKTISFDEGTLTYLTALKLKSLLEQEGAIVFLTRSGISQGCMKETFFEWLEKHPELWKETDSLSQLFRRHYNREDMAARIAAINNFRPDLTLIIHYNASNSNSVTTQANYNMAFIPGAFNKGDLDQAEGRYEFLRLIVTQDLEESLSLSKHITKQFVQKLKVPLIADSQKDPYEPTLCIKQADGIYSRNLFLTRHIHGPLCYGETLIQNNTVEIYRISNLDSEVEGIPCSHRILEVAQAYFIGVKNYFRGESVKRTKRPLAKKKVILRPHSPLKSTT